MDGTALTLKVTSGARLRGRGIANNVHYGAGNIAASIARLDEIGVLHTGAEPDLTAARAPAIVERNGRRGGFLQRSSVYWPTDHEARDDAPGIAVVRGHAAYHVPMGRTHAGIPPADRPGVPPAIITWADAAYPADLHSAKPKAQYKIHDAAQR
jgi:poly-gamma-glutamate synthesis protein (capsule biosynthesis protein)